MALLIPLPFLLSLFSPLFLSFRCSSYPLLTLLFPFLLPSSHPKRNHSPLLLSCLLFLQRILFSSLLFFYLFCQNILRPCFCCCVALIIPFLLRIYAPVSLLADLFPFLNILCPCFCLCFPHSLPLLNSTPLAGFIPLDAPISAYNLTKSASPYVAACTVYVIIYFTNSNLVIFCSSRVLCTYIRLSISKLGGKR